MSSSEKFLNHMIKLLELDIYYLEEQAREGIELAIELLPLVEEELKNYEKKLELLKQ